MISLGAQKLIERLQEAGVQVCVGVNQYSVEEKKPVIIIEEIEVTENKEWNWNHHFFYVKDLESFSFYKKRRERHFDLKFKLRIGHFDEFGVLEIAEKLFHLFSQKSELFLVQNERSYSCFVRLLNDLVHPEQKKLDSLSEGLLELEVEMVPLVSKEAPVTGTLIQTILVDLQTRNLGEET